MTRISLQEQYDNKDVIQQIYNLKKKQDDMADDVGTAVQKADQALSTASSFKTAIDSVVAEQGRLTEEIGAQTQQIQDIQSMTTTAVNSIRNETQASLSTMENTISAQDLTGMVVGIAGTGKFNVTAQRAKGNVVSNTYDTCKVTKATLGKGALNNSVYVELTLSDGSVVRSGDAVIDISGVEADVHVTGCTLHEGENDHSLYLEFTLNDGSSFRSNTISYDYPGIASSSVPGLVKSGTNEGEVQVTSDGIPSVIGYSTLKAAVEKNATDIATNATNIQANDDAITAIEGQIGSDEAQGTIRGEIASLKAADTAMDARITTNAQGITALDGRVTALDTKVDQAVSTLRTDMQNADTALGTRIDGVVESVNGKMGQWDVKGILDLKYEGSPVTITSYYQDGVLKNVEPYSNNLVYRMQVERAYLTQDDDYITLDLNENGYTVNGIKSSNSTIKVTVYTMPLSEFEDYADPNGRFIMDIGNVLDSDTVSARTLKVNGIEAGSGCQWVFSSSRYAKSSEITAVSNDLTALTQTVDGHTSSITTLTSDVGTAKTDISTIKTDISNLNTQVSAADSKAVAAQSTADSATSLANAAQTTADQALSKAGLNPGWTKQTMTGGISYTTKSVYLDKQFTSNTLVHLVISKSNTTVRADASCTITIDNATKHVTATGFDKDPSAYIDVYYEEIAGDAPNKVDVVAGAYFGMMDVSYTVKTDTVEQKVINIIFNRIAAANQIDLLDAMMSRNLQGQFASTADNDLAVNVIENTLYPDLASEWPYLVSLVDNNENDVYPNAMAVVSFTPSDALSGNYAPIAIVEQPAVSAGLATETTVYVPAKVNTTPATPISMILVSKD